jgi:hypothetical protein
LLGDLDLAEEAMYEAFAVALETWPQAGLPNIDMNDMDALWNGLGIDTSDWLPTDPYAANKGNYHEFSMLYTAQGFIAFQREYRLEQLDQLIEGGRITERTSRQAFDPRRNLSPL